MIVTISRLLAGTAALACAVAFSQPGLAQGKGHGGGGGAGVMNSIGINSIDRDLGTDRAGDRMSKQGLSNSNGPNSTDRDFGKARAQDRSHK